MAKFGSMQGRLVPPEDGRLQSFPRERWRDEFGLAKAAGLDYIEWIYDAYGLGANPILEPNGVSAMLELKQGTGVELRSMCADYFMDYPLLRCTTEECSARLDRLFQLIDAAEQLGMNRIVLPFVDVSAMNTEDEMEAVVKVLRVALPFARKSGIELHLEASLSPQAFAAFLQRIPDPMLKVNYDSGNSASLGYAVKEEFAAYGEAVGSIHIKDRKRGASTVPLGTGAAELTGLAECVREARYQGDFTLQVARGTAGEEVAWTKQNLAYTKKLLQID
jgi:L-ribulose-5-phosphate 3-epimerase